MKTEIVNSFKRLYDTFDIFKDNVQKSKEDYEKELVVQRFVLIVDLFLQTLKSLLEVKGYSCILPQDCIKAAARFGFLASDTIFLEMLDDKYKLVPSKNPNNPVNQKVSEAMYQKIKIRYTIAIGKSLERIQRDYFGNSL